MKPRTMTIVLSYDEDQVDTEELTTSVERQLGLIARGQPIRLMHLYDQEGGYERPKTLVDGAPLV